MFSNTTPNTPPRLNPSKQGPSERSWWGVGVAYTTMWSSCPGMRHLGHILVFMLLLMSFVGFVYGRRKIALIALLGLSAYSVLTAIY